MIATHASPTLHLLERLAAHGGRRSVWCVANFGDAPFDDYVVSTRDGPVSVPRLPGPIYSIDVRGMYGHILSNSLLPIRAFHFNHGYYCPLSLEAFVEIAQYFGVIAFCEIETEVPEFPQRTARGIVYPRGRFATVLTGPELAYLHETGGKLVRLGPYAFYHLGDAWQPVGRELLTARCQLEGVDPLAAKYAKLVVNAAVGRLALRQHSWKRAPEWDGLHRFGFEVLCGANDGSHFVLRWIDGLAQIRSSSEVPRGPHVAAFAYVTALGRIRMARVRAQLPPHSVIQQDTDGLYVTAAGYEVVRTLPDWGTDFGQLCDDTAVSAARFFTPQHYWIDGVWVASGFHEVSYDPVLRKLVANVRECGFKSM